MIEGRMRAKANYNPRSMLHSTPYTHLYETKSVSPGHFWLSRLAAAPSAHSLIEHPHGQLEKQEGCAVGERRPGTRIDRQFRTLFHSRSL